MYFTVVSAFSSSFVTPALLPPLQNQWQPVPLTPNPRASSAASTKDQGAGTALFPLVLLPTKFAPHGQSSSPPSPSWQLLEMAGEEGQDLPPTISLLYLVAGSWIRTGPPPAGGGPDGDVPPLAGSDAPQPAGSDTPPPAGADAPPLSP